MRNVYRKIFSQMILLRLRTRLEFQIPGTRHQLERERDSSNLRTQNCVQWGNEGKVFPSPTSEFENSSSYLFYERLVTKMRNSRSRKDWDSSNLAKTSNKLERLIACESEMISVSVFMPGMPRLFFYAGQIFELVLRKWNEQCWRSA